MKKHTTKITSNSIENNLTPDIKKAIAEYIWNGFDADASIIDIDFESNEIGYITSFTITDNGKGINFPNIEKTFGNFLDSEKANSYDQTSFVKGKKGKGRYSFVTFCNEAVWDTTFVSDTGEFLNYKIKIKRGDSHNFNTYDNVVSKTKKTGTKVSFDSFTNLTGDIFENEEFLTYLSSEFGWFLMLNRHDNYQIRINNSPIKYDNIIKVYEESPITIGDNEFLITFIRWDRKIGDKYYFYYMNGLKKEMERKHTSFNNKSNDFHHSVYVISSYFDNFNFTKTDDPILIPEYINQADLTFKKLSIHLNNLVSEQEKVFIKEYQANKLIETFNLKKILPNFKRNAYDAIRKEDLENVIKEIYSVQPKIFQGLKATQSKTLVGFLNLLLDSEQREEILDILEGIVNLSEEERQELSKTLKNTNLSSIVALVKLLENRFRSVSVLKSLVFELEKFTNERDHIQKVVENNYWLFGEEYHMVSADQNFETMLSNYEHFLVDGEVPAKGAKKEKLNSTQKLKRPDVFICRQHEIPDPDSSEYTIEENIIVELKRPHIVIGKEQYDQVENYLRIVTTEPRFNTVLRKWKFILIGKELDSLITDKHDSQKNKGKRFLVESIRNYEIYAMTWADLFKIFDLKHNHLIRKLEFRDTIIEELQAQGIEIGRLMSDRLTELDPNTVN